MWFSFIPKKSIVDGKPSGITDGGFFDSGLQSTRDMDVLWNVQARLRFFSSDPTASTNLIDILRKADRSFEPTGEGSYRALNRDGYMVDLVKPEPKSLLIQENRQKGNDEDLKAAEIRNLQWLVASPKFTHVVVGGDGYPATMVAPDPRAFALHKLWLSRQDGREPVIRKRDHAQAIAVFRLVCQYFSNLIFHPEELRMFPKPVVEEVKNEIEESDLPPGYHSSDQAWDAGLNM